MKKPISKIREWLSILSVEHPQRVVLLWITLFNLFFMLLSAALITYVAKGFNPDLKFFEALYYTVSMILDAGCISYVIESANQAGAIATLLCLGVVLIGMISFTGCIIGYITNLISDFVDHASSGKRKLNVSNHTVILNWNSRASEIVNDLMFSEEKEIIVVLVREQKEEIEEEIQNRLADTINQENKAIQESIKDLSYFKRLWYMYKNHFRNQSTIIIREGDPYSEAQLLNISVDKAKTVLILNHEEENNGKEDVQIINQGNSLMIKTLVLVAEITSQENSIDDQKIIVEVDDEWTYELVQKIIHYKEKLQKCNIIPFSVNKVLGQLLSQFAIMPDLNQVYSLLFSEEGAEFYFIDQKDLKEQDIESFMNVHHHAIFLTGMESKTGSKYYYLANHRDSIDRTMDVRHTNVELAINPHYWLPKRNILILGHNSKMEALMEEFNAFYKEWGVHNPYGDNLLNIGIIDDADSVRMMNHYRNYSYVNQNYVVPTDIYSESLIYDTIDSFFDEYEGSTCILILSDDSVTKENLDASTLTYLIYVQDLLEKRKVRLGGKDTEKVDVVVEIINPENYDVARSYSVQNVVITNRYISKMMNQIGQKESLYEFYTDILTYDSDDSKFTSKELYIKSVKDFYSTIPGPCKAGDLVLSTYKACKKMDPDNESIVIGTISQEGKMVIFGGNNMKINVQLKDTDSLILFSNH